MSTTEKVRWTSADLESLPDNGKRYELIEGELLIKNIEIPKNQIVDFCQRWQITEFALFGSVLRDDFRPDSDIDILASFEPDFHWTLLKLMQMEEELEAIFERKVDFVSKGAIKHSLNYLRRQAILNSAQVIYAVS